MQPGEAPDPLELWAMNHVHYHNRREVLHMGQVGQIVQFQFSQRKPLAAGKPWRKIVQLAVTNFQSL